MMGIVSRYFYQRLGRRGTVLVIYGTGYAGYGGGQFIGAPATRFGDLGPLTTLVNSHAFGWVWIIGGLTGIIVGLRPRRENDGAGFVAVLIPVLVWVGLYASSCVVGLTSGGVYGNPNAWVTSFVWLVLGLALPVIAGWPDPETDGARSE